MIRFPYVVTVLSGLMLVGCGDAKDDTASDVDLVLPNAGNWTIITHGWTNDDCNAEEGLMPPSSFTVADVADSSFSVTFYDGDVRVGDGSTSFTHDSDDSFTALDFTHSLAYTDIDATLSMTGVLTISVTSETEAAGVGALVLDCTGEDCFVLAQQTNSGVIPCDTTSNWTATAD